jgi:hypothetical protein
MDDHGTCGERFGTVKTIRALTNGPSTVPGFAGTGAGDASYQPPRPVVTGDRVDHAAITEDDEELVLLRGAVSAGEVVGVRFDPAVPEAEVWPDDACPIGI